MTTRLSRRLLLQTAMASLSTIGQTFRARGATPPRFRMDSGEIDAALQAAVNAADVPGVVAMAATAEAVLYQGSFGLRDVSGTSKMSMETVFRIASMVKLLTSIAALQLVETGKLRLDDPAAKVDPTLASPQVLLGFDAGGVPLFRPAQKPITLRNLLSHTSGFSYQLWDPNVVRYLRVTRTKPDLPRMPLMFDPGTRWAYGSGLDRVGRLVEIASGKRLDRYFHDHILGPLGLTNTGFSLTEDQRAREASLHFRKADGTLLSQPLERTAAPKAFSGGGGIYSTAPDYLTLLQALLNSGSLKRSTILRPETVSLMDQNQIRNLEAGILKTTNPALSSDIDFFPGIRLRWGLGHLINLDPIEYGRKAGSLTWAGLYNTYYWMDPASGIAGVIMMQVLPFADERALNVYRQFERSVYRCFVRG
jgi:methyl acetate hydrolase